MLNRICAAHRFLPLVAFPVLLCYAGCGADDGLGRRYAVTGKVTYKGAPVAKARISLVPIGTDSTARGAHGEVDNGTFSLTTMSPGDGALPGEYKVTVDAREVDEAKLREESEKAFQKHGMGKMAMMPPEFQAKFAKEAKSSIPAKYQSVEGSDLKVTVKEETNNFELELKD
jgi:hypothetical protein